MRSGQAYLGGGEKDRSGEWVVTPSRRDPDHSPPLPTWIVQLKYQSRKFREQHITLVKTRHIFCLEKNTKPTCTFLPPTAMTLWTLPKVLYLDLSQFSTLLHHFIFLTFHNFLLLQYAPIYEILNTLIGQSMTTSTNKVAPQDSRWRLPPAGIWKI